MKNKRIRFFSACLAIVLIGLFLAAFIQPMIVHSAPTTTASTTVPSTGFLNVCKKGGTIAGCINGIYLLSLGLGALVATMMIVVAGYRYMAAQGNASQVESAKDAFTSAFIGLIIIFVGFILLHLINPSLTQFKDLPLPNIPTGTPPPGNNGAALTCNITASPASLPSGGGQVTVSWTSNGTKGILHSSVGNFIPTPVSPNGSRPFDLVDSGNFNFSLDASNDANQTQTCSTSVAVAAGGHGNQIQISAQGLNPFFTEGDFLVTIFFSASPAGNYTWRLDGPLPADLTFDSSGTITGSLATGSQGRYPITITATASDGTHASQPYLIVVNPKTP